MKTNTQYAKVTNEELMKVGEENPQQALLLLASHLTSNEAEEKVQGKIHNPIEHDSGWSITIETSNGVVGLWSCWLDNQFYLGYPKTLSIDENLIKEMLGVTNAEAVHYCRNGKLGTRKWAEFYSERVSEEDYGRVWIFTSTGPFQKFNYIKDEELKYERYGESLSNHIFVYPYTHANEKEIDAPTSEPKYIKPYKEKFLKLLIEVSKQLGEIEAINIEYGFVFVPEQLETQGYTNIKCIKGNINNVQGFGGTVIYGRKGEEEIVLQTANSLVPWVNIRRIPISSEQLTVNKILDLLIF